MSISLSGILSLEFIPRTAKAILVQTLITLSMLLLVPGCSPPAEDEMVHRTQLMTELALKVRSQMGTDFSHTLSEYATSAARNKFAAITEEVWTIHSPVMGWSYFASVSVPVIANVNGTQPVIAYYHPWSDFFLVTAWDFPGEWPVLTDVELIPGDVVRHPGAEMPNPVPYWLDSSSYPPEAIGRSVAESINSFLALFPAEQTLTDWRSQLDSTIKEPNSETLHYAIAAHNLSMNLINIENFWSASSEESPELALLRESVIEKIATATQQGLQKLLTEAKASEPYMDVLIKNISKEAITRLEIVYYLRARDEALVFLAPSGGQYFALALQMQNRNGQWQAARIDAVPYVLMVKSTYL